MAMTNRWSSRRKKFIFGLVIVALVFLVGIPAGLFFYKAPTCSDNKQNGDERGVDCGGSCQLLCAVESLPIVQKGDAQVITVAPGVYEVVAIFENPNVDAEIYRANYSIKLYSAGNPVAVKIIDGSTYIPRNSSFAVFEGPFAFPDSVPQKASFSWDNNSLVWEKTEKSLPSVSIQSKNLTNASTTPRLDISVLNKSLGNISNLELVVLISDKSGNVFAASKTFLDNLSAGATTPAVFTWPRGFENEVGLIDIIPRVLPDKSFIR